MKRRWLIVAVITFMLPAIACSGACGRNNESVTAKSVAPRNQNSARSTEAVPNSNKAANANQPPKSQQAIDSRLTAEIK